VTAPTTRRPAFVRAVSFPSKPPIQDSDIPMAWLHLQDSTDDHKFKIAVDVDFGRTVAKAIEDDIRDGSGDLRVTLDITIGHEEER